jgi:hypothetical protein
MKALEFLTHCLRQVAGERFKKFAKINNRIYGLQVIFIDTVFTPTRIKFRSSAHSLKQ